MDGSTKRTVGKIVLGTLAVWFVLWLTAFSPESNVESPPTYQVKARQVSYQTYPKMVTIYGKVSPLDPLHIDAEVSTTIKEILVENGQSVKEGDIIMQLDDTDFQLKKADLQQAVNKTNNKIQTNEQEIEALNALIDHDAMLLQNAQDLLNRYQSLSDKFKSQQGIAQRQDAVNLRAKSLEQNQSAKRTLLNQIKELEINLKQLSIQVIDNAVDINNCLIKADSGGMISQIDHELGDFVQRGQPLCIIINPNKTYIHAYVPSQYYGQLQPGLRARLRDKDNTPLYLKESESQVQQGAAHLDTLFYYSDNIPLLPIGKVVTLAIELPTGSDSFLAPEAAIYEQNYVYSIKNNLLQKHKVSVLGTYYQNNQTEYLISASDIVNGDTILISHLPWPKSGQSVTYEE